MPNTSVRKTIRSRTTPSSRKTPSKLKTPRKTPSLKIPTPPPSVVYVLYCHGEELYGQRIPIPFYQGRTIRLDYYVECGVTLYGGPVTLNHMCQANAVPTLSILSGSTANQMVFGGDEHPERINTMGIYLCDGQTQTKILDIWPNEEYHLNQIIDVIMNYHSNRFLDREVSFSISLHTCRVFEKDPVRVTKYPVVMNPENELANAFAESLKIADKSTPTKPGIRRKWTALRKTLQQRKEEAEFENAAIENALNDVVQKMTQLRVSTPAQNSLKTPAQSSLKTPAPLKPTRKRTIQHLENPLNRKKTTMSKTKRTRSSSPKKTT